MENAMKYMVVLSCVILFNDIAVCARIRERRQAAPDYADDYDKKDDAANEDAGAVDNVDDAPADGLEDTNKDARDEPPAETRQEETNADFGGDDFTAPAPERPPKRSHSSEERSEEERKRKKKAKKKNKFVRDVIKYLKKVLTPQNIMQNQWVTEMLRKFSNSADDDYKSAESVEHTQKPPPGKRRRGRPRGRRSRKKMPKNLKGLLAYGLRTVAQIDRNKLRRNLRYVRRIARKAKKPLKAAVRIFLNTRTNGVGGTDGGFGGGGGGGGGYGNTY